MLKRKKVNQTHQKKARECMYKTQKHKNALIKNYIRSGYICNQKLYGINSGSNCYENFTKFWK